MIPAAFEYVAPATLDEALALLHQHGEDARLLAGGHSLVPLMKLRLATPGVLIDLGKLRELQGVRREQGRVVIGALTTYHALTTATELAGLTALQEGAAAVGDIQVRNRGTIGGSLAHADPGADLPAAMLALTAEFVLRGPDGERTVPAADFFLGLLTTAIAPGEVLTEIRIPLPPPRTGSSYVKFANPASGYAMAGAAAVITLAADGMVAAARIGITGAGDRAARASAVEAALSGQHPRRDVIQAASRLAADELEPMDDLHASAAYRAELARVCTRRAVERAVQRASETG